MAPHPYQPDRRSAAEPVPACRDCTHAWGAAIHRKVVGR